MVVCLLGLIGGVVVDGSLDQAPPSPAGSGVGVAGIGLATDRRVVREVGAVLRSRWAARWECGCGSGSGRETRCRSVRNGGCRVPLWLWLCCTAPPEPLGVVGDLARLVVGVITASGQLVSLPLSFAPNDVSCPASGLSRSLLAEARGAVLIC